MAQPGSTGEAVGENAMPASACSAAVNHESLHQTACITTLLSGCKVQGVSVDAEGVTHA